LIKHIIAGDLKKKGITDVNPMTLAADECTAPGGYSWGA
jgi:cytochrome bd-type quinol oxidase subunit 1